ncbi:MULTISPECIES: hypothetical protein [unclassified Sinorhizobium]|uniref:hypothetical protein n=1 Tax=unclassified Sinorhizobium TaxID=2613772 RepID=UPI003525F5B1
MKNLLSSPEHADTLSLDALSSLVSGLLETSQHAEARFDKLDSDNVQVRDENANLRLERETN